MLGARCFLDVIVQNHIRTVQSFTLVLILAHSFYGVMFSRVSLQLLVCPTIHRCVCHYIQSVDVPKWSFTVASHVGAGLLSRLMDTAKLSLQQSNDRSLLQSHELLACYSLQ